MITYNAAEFLLMVFELDAIVGGNYGQEMFRGSPSRQGMYLTTRALAKAWRIPPPEYLMSRKHRPDVVGVMVEARRSLETIFARRRTYMAGVSRELRVSHQICGMLLQSRIELDQMLARELHIADRPIWENDVVKLGGMDKETLNLFMIDDV